MSQDGSRERTNQKARTRTDLLQSAGALIRAGKRPTVEEAALAAGISKRTAYRYFTSQDHLLADAALETLRPHMEAVLTSVAEPTDVHARVRALAIALRQLSERHDPELREMIRASLDRGATLTRDAPRQRGGRRLEWIRMALDPLRETLSTDRFEALTNSLAVCLGIDAWLVLSDVCGMTGEQAEQLTVWMADALLDRMIAENAEERR
ncbi:TetR/AcrR family transcriptional regulator [Sphingomonas azotifigens]|uniref:TetR/AcrR family transcriptional regulator n=1 Tax=Sphingomonas azotifigens TaxID=330920 RepID=UPI000A07B7A8|nr:TetR/AcrR family transcriptional regulator [Sphingomonas azotifigens]